MIVYDTNCENTTMVLKSPTLGTENHSTCTSSLKYGGSLHLMHRRLGRPTSELLPVEVERNRTKTPQRRQAHVQHNRPDEPLLHDPRRDEFAEAIPPEILVDRDGDKYRAGNRLVAIDGVGAGDGREGGDLDACRCVSNDDNDLKRLDAAVNE